MYGLQSGSSAGYRPQAPTPLAGSPPGATSQYLAYSYGGQQAQYQPYQPSPSPAFGTQNYAPAASQPQPARYNYQPQQSDAARQSAYGDRYYQPSSAYGQPNAANSTGMSSYTGSSYAAPTAPSADHSRSDRYDNGKNSGMQPAPSRSAYASSGYAPPLQQNRPSYENTDARPYEYDHQRTGAGVADPRQRESAPVPEARSYASSQGVSHPDPGPTAYTAMPVGRTPEPVKLPQPMQARSQPQPFRSAQRTPSASDDINERTASFLQRRAREGTAPAGASYSAGGGKVGDGSEAYRSASRDNTDGRESSQSRQNLVGVGIVFQQYDDGKMYVKSLVKGEAASLADPRPAEGDCIVGVDDQDVSYCDLAHLRTLVIGRPSTAVILKLVRPTGLRYETVVIRGSKTDQNGGRISATGSAGGEMPGAGSSGRYGGGDRKGVLSPSSDRDRMGSPYDMYSGRQSADRGGSGAGTDAAMERARQEINKMRGGTPQDQRGPGAGSSLYGSRDGDSYAAYAARGASSESAAPRYDERYRRREGLGEGPNSARGAGAGYGESGAGGRSAGGYGAGAGYRNLASPSSSASSARDHSGRSRSADPPQWRGEQDAGSLGRGGHAEQPRRPASSLATAMQRLQEELQDSRPRLPRQPPPALSGIREGSEARTAAGGGLYGSRDGKDPSYLSARPAVPPSNTPTGGYQPSGTPTGVYQPSNTPTSGYQPSNTPTSGYQPSGAPTSGYQPAGYQPGRYQGMGAYAPSPGHYGGNDIYNAGSYGSAGGYTAGAYGRRY